MYAGCQWCDTTKFSHLGSEGSEKLKLNFLIPKINLSPKITLVIIVCSILKIPDMFPSMTNSYNYKCKLHGNREDVTDDGPTEASSATVTTAGEHFNTIMRH